MDSGCRCKIGLGSVGRLMACGRRDAGPDHAKPPPTDPDGGVAAQGQTESKEGGKPGLKTTAS